MLNLNIASKIVFIPIFIFCIFINNRLSAQQVSIQSSDAKTGLDEPTVHNLTNVPAGALLVLSTTCQYGSGSEMNAAVSSNPSLTWSKRVDATATGGAEMYTAVFTAGGSIAVTSNWGTTNRYQSSVCYIVINQEATLGGASATNGANGQSLPSVGITTTRNNSLIFCATSDWNNGAGDIIYRGNATETHTANNPDDATFYHYYYSAATAGAITVGMTSPDMEDGGSTAVLEIRGPEADVTPPSAPSLNNSPAITSTTIGLSWSASTDNVGVTGYEVYVGGVLNTTTTNTNYTVTGLTPSTQYSIYVRAKDAAGNGTNSNTITPTTTASSQAWDIVGNPGTNPTTNFIGTTDAQNLSLRTNNVQRILISADGKVGIGTTAITGGNYGLYVQDGIRTTKVKVDLGTAWPDYVFHRQYKLPTLKEVEEFIQKNKHLPDVPTAAEMEKEGLDVGDNQAILLKKIEELTLYLIEVNKKVENLAEENKSLKRKLEIKAK